MKVLLSKPERHVLNVQACLREHKLPSVSVFDKEMALLAPQEDKCFSPSYLGMREAFDRLFDEWDLLIDSPDHRPLGKKTAVRGWRERGARWRMQVILHFDDVSEISFFEFDFDANNPNWGLGPALFHIAADWLLQKLRKRKTNPFTVAKKRGWLAPATRSATA